MPRSGVLKKTNPKSSYFADAREKFKEHRLAVFGLAVLTALVVIVVFAPMLFPLDPYTSDYFEFGTAPSAKHPLGTDAVGRDLLARLIYGGRTSLFVGLTSTLISLLIGVPLGLTAGYYRGWWETLVMRLADIFMSFPAMVLILVLVAVVGPSIWSVTYGCLEREHRRCQRRSTFPQLCRNIIPHPT